MTEVDAATSGAATRTPRASIGWMPEAGDALHGIVSHEAGDGSAVSRSWREITASADELAGALTGECRTGDRVVIALPSSIDYIEVLLACFSAGVVAVPASAPSGAWEISDRLEAILADCN